jgi:chemotaxis protein methyltransferase CheR
MSGYKTMETLPIFARFIARTMGLHFTCERLPELERKMTSLGSQAGFPDVEKYLLWLMSAPLSREQLETLARTLTIGETYFLRDPRSYQVLEEELLPKLIAARRASDKSLRIWSAGCSSGEEPYSIAILLSRLIPDIASWKITLLATDINPLALERGRRGVYSQWSFRNAPRWLMDYFTKRKDGRFEIVPRIRKMVRFSHLNLADEGVLAASDGTNKMDIIFCRNVMLYFDAALIEKTMARFHAALNDTGWLFVGPTEVDHRTVKGFSCRHYGGAFVLSKASTQQEAAGTRWPAILPHGQESAAPAEKSAAAFPIELPPASVAKPSAAPALVPSFGSASPEENESGAKEMLGPSGYAEALDLYQAGRYQQAADRALSSLDAGEERASALALGARAYANIGRFDEARECCEKAIVCDRLSAQNHYLLSIILEQQGDTAGAVRSLKHALYIDHDYLLAYFALGNLYRQCGEQSESERNFANALRLLEKRHPHEVLPEAEGMTAGRLAQIIRAMSAGKGA